MLGKLIKYEFKATYKLMLMMYGLLILMSLIIGLGIRMNFDEVIRGLENSFEIGALIFQLLELFVVILYFILNVLVTTGMIFYAITRFKNNLLSDEGYLMNTLPVKTGANIMAKCISATLWTIFGFIVTIISYFMLIFITVDVEALKNISEFFRLEEIRKLLTPGSIAIMCELLILFILSIMNGYLCIYASMSVGYSANSNKVLKSIGSYILISFATSCLESVLVSPFSFYDISERGIVEGIHTIFIFSIIVTLIEMIIYYIISNYYMKKKLNLQ